MPYTGISTGVDEIGPEVAGFMLGPARAAADFGTESLVGATSVTAFTLARRFSRIDDIRIGALHGHWNVEASADAARAVGIDRPLELASADFRDLGAFEFVPQVAESVEIQQHHIRRAARAAGLGDGIGWHTFRHGYRSWLDDTGAPLTVQKELMRHASIQTTMNIYGKAMTDSKRQAHSRVVEMVMNSPAKARLVESKSLSRLAIGSYWESAAGSESQQLIGRIGCGGRI